MKKITLCKPFFQWRAKEKAISFCQLIIATFDMMVSYFATSIFNDSRIRLLSVHYYHLFVFLVVLSLLLL